MRAVLAVALAACVHAQPPAPAQLPAPPPARPPPAHDACADEAARLQPMLDANAALYQRWGDRVIVDPAPLVPAIGELEPLTDRIPAIIVSPNRVSLLGRDGAPPAVAFRVRALLGRDAMATGAVALAIARDTPWREVVELVHALQGEGLARVKLVFAVDRSAVAIADNPIAARLRGADSIEVAREIGRDVGTRCPALGDLFLLRAEDRLQVMARETMAALRSCKCAVSPAELANIYAAIFVPPYVAARTLTLSRTGAVIAASGTATFADAARWIAALAPDAPARFEVSRP